MEEILSTILQYPYFYKRLFYLTLAILFLISGSILWGLYKLITWKMSLRSKEIIKGVIYGVGFLGFVVFLVIIAFCLITTTQVNRQMGFTYATPDTPEGELFIIQKVVPGKIMHEAGLQEYDRVLLRGPDDLYGRLIHNQGSEVLIPVSRDGEELIIKVIVPELHVPFVRLCVFFKHRPD